MFPQAFAIIMVSYVGQKKITVMSHGLTDSPHPSTLPQNRPFPNHQPDRVTVSHSTDLGLPGARLVPLRRTVWRSTPESWWPRSRWSATTQSSLDLGRCDLDRPKQRQERQELAQKSRLQEPNGPCRWGISWIGSFMALWQKSSAILARHDQTDSFWF